MNREMLGSGVNPGFLPSPPIHVRSANDDYDFGALRPQRPNEARKQDTGPSQARPAIPQSENKVSTRERIHGAFRAIVQIGDRWGLTDEQLRVVLGYDSASEISNLRNETPQTISRDQKKRMQCVFEIHSTLFNLYQDFDPIYRWLRTPTELLGSSTPLSTMLTGDIEDLLRTKYAASWFARR